MERMTREDLADWARGAEQETVLWERRNAAEALTLMDERDACARRLAAAERDLAAIRRITRKQRKENILPSLCFDDERWCAFCARTWATGQPEEHKIECAWPVVAAIEAVLNKHEAAPHGPGAARGGVMAEDNMMKIAATVRLRRVENPAGVPADAAYEVWEIAEIFDVFGDVGLMLQPRLPQIALYRLKSAAPRPRIQGAEGA